MLSYHAERVFSTNDEFCIAKGTNGKVSEGTFCNYWPIRIVDSFWRNANPGDHSCSTENAMNWKGVSRKQWKTFPLNFGDGCIVIFWTLCYVNAVTNKASHVL